MAKPGEMFPRSSKWLPAYYQRENDKLEAELFFVKTIRKRDDVLGLISIQGIEWKLFEMTKAFSEG